MTGSDVLCMSVVVLVFRSFGYVSQTFSEVKCVAEQDTLSFLIHLMVFRCSLTFLLNN